MFIQTESTPNPSMRKFLPGQTIVGDAPPQDFPNAAAASHVPLAQALFDIDGVESVFFGKDFITIGKTDTIEDWAPLTAQILGVMIDFLSSGAPILPTAEAAPDPVAPSASNDSAVVRSIKQILDTHIRPAVAQDGGDIVFKDFVDGVVHLQMRGACAGCPSAAITLQQGVENLLRHYVPAVQAVQAEDL